MHSGKPYHRPIQMYEEKMHPCGRISAYMPFVSCRIWNNSGSIFQNSVLALMLN